MCGGRKNLVQKIWLRIWMEPDGFQRRAGRGWRRTVYGEGLYLLQIPRKTRSRSTSNAADTKLERRFGLLSLSAGVFGGFSRTSYIRQRRLYGGSCVLVG